MNINPDASVKARFRIDSNLLENPRRSRSRGSGLRRAIPQKGFVGTNAIKCDWFSSLEGEAKSRSLTRQNAAGKMRERVRDDNCVAARWRSAILRWPLRGLVWGLDFGEVVAGYA